VDLDRDGRVDVLSGSYLPGDVFVGLGRVGGGFAAPRALTLADGTPLRTGRASWPFACDWEGDGDLDLVLGNMYGKVFLARNASGGAALALGAPQPLEVAGAPLALEETNAAPCIADWDGDDAHDLLLGTGDGTVLLFRNTAARGREPVLAAPHELVRKALDGEARVRLARSGQRARLAVTDWNADGRLDLVVGEHASEDGAARTLSPAEERELAAAIQASAELGTRRGALERAALARWLEAKGLPPTRSAEHYDDFLVEWLASAEGRALVAEAEELAARQRRLNPEWIEHGRVWVFLRRPASNAERPRDER
jgi:hypothetical protein